MYGDILNVQLSTRKKITTPCYGVDSATGNTLPL
jgi:hypothetical protein